MKALFLTLMALGLAGADASAAQVEYTIRRCVAEGGEIRSDRCESVRQRRLKLAFRRPPGATKAKHHKDLIFDHAQIDGLEFLLSGWKSQPTEKWPHDSDELVIQVFGPRKKFLHHSEFVFFEDKESNYVHLPVHTGTADARYTVEVRQVD